jgi:hypothetical protein
MRQITAAAIAALVLVAGCGGESGDLMSIEITGGPTAEKHTVVVTGDGRGSCDRGAEKLLPSARVIDAREIEKEVGDLATRAAVYPVRQGARQYKLSTTNGDVRWGEGTPGIPSVLPRAQLLALQLERLLCRGG